MCTLSAVSSSTTITSAHSHMCMISKHWRASTPLASKDGNFEQPTHWLYKLEVLEFSKRRQNIAVLWRMIQVAFLVVGWPWGKFLRFVKPVSSCIKGNNDLSQGFWGIKCNTHHNLLIIGQMSNQYFYFVLSFECPLPFLHSFKRDWAAHAFYSISKICLKLISYCCSSSGPVSPSNLSCVLLLSLYFWRANESSTLCWQ